MPKAPSKHAPFKPGQRVRLSIANLAAGGDGVGRTREGYTVFVPFSVPGDLLDVEFTQTNKTFGRGKITGVVEPGAHRVEPACPVAGTCGGCGWQQMDYAAQVAAKEGLVRESLARIGGLAASHPVLPAAAAGPPLGYRNRAQVPVRSGAGGTLEMGFFAAGSHQVVPLPKQGCAIQSRALNQVLLFLRQRLQEEAWEAFDDAKGEGPAALLRHLVLRDNHLGEVMAVLVTTRTLDTARTAQATAWIKDCPALSCVLNHVQSGPGNTVLGGRTYPLAGPGHLEDSVGGLRFRLSAESFFQVNREQTLRLWDRIQACRTWTGKERVLELYCGVGTLSLFVAGLCGQLWGYENSAQAVEDARANADRNARSNARFFSVAAEKAFGHLWDQEQACDLVLVDPPRKGLSPQVMAALLTHRPAEIIYVSCDPGTLARDLGLLIKNGYQAGPVAPVDLFPQTWHVESVVTLKREDPGAR